MLWENDEETIIKLCTDNQIATHLNIDADPVGLGGQVEVDVAVEEGDVGLGQVPGAQAEHPGHRVDAEHHLLRGVGTQLIQPVKSVK